MYSETKPLDIQLKLLTDDNVILALCEGFETEIFMPSVIDGRITIINVIPQRRCNCITTTHIVGKRKKPCKNYNDPISISRWRMSTSSDSLLKRKHFNNPIEAPLAYSTPAPRKSYANSTQENEQPRIQDSTIPSPQEVRRALLPLDDSEDFPMPRNRKMQSLTKTTITKTYSTNERNLLKSRTSDEKSSENSLRSENVNISNIQYPSTPPILPYKPTKTKDIDLPSTLSPYSAQWRSVIAPTKTYSRQKYTPNRVTELAKGGKTSNYFVTPSKAPKSDKRAIMKKIKLVIDKKLSISPKSFKEQMKSKTVSSRQCLHDELEKHPFHMKKVPAFDLLTTPFRSHKRASFKLQQQFKKKCINKASSTYPKYKKLCELPNKEKRNMETKTSEELTRQKVSNDVPQKEGFFTPESISCEDERNGNSTSSLQRMQPLLN